ncbi:amino acid ABC transporter permease [Paludicola sp. MB14-C6]|uniref:amino acid ABC transporter permease n=1 Tax=Paludihabitans sp. MB14-C6 TaxID=3070656 RepID=UPI0027DE04BA|nr:amino acid ABC transporter permease [Paludicola sp. MB14-C6]WMJ22001.1 amino acid ABC transporter permease [Paludicola sp. MB14-C6]
MEGILNEIYDALFKEQRYLMILDGLKNTLIIALFATIIGVIIGTIVAIVKNASIGRKSLWIFDKICDLYITIIRGTPLMIQLLILAGAIMASVKNYILIAIVGFGLNSGAYVAEIIRAGILAVDKGQMEAGRSLGLTSAQTMKKIIMPQAIKNILPALGNEFIVLLKETSIAGYIAVQDLTNVGNVIRASSYNTAIYFIIAGIYLLLVVGMTAILKRFEMRLAKSDRG